MLICTGLTYFISLSISSPSSSHSPAQPHLPESPWKQLSDLADGNAAPPRHAHREHFHVELLQITDTVGIPGHSRSQSSPGRRPGEHLLKSVQGSASPGISQLGCKPLCHHLCSHSPISCVCLLAGCFFTAAALLCWREETRGEWEAKKCGVT